MPPKQKAEDLKEESFLIAVLIPETFNANFQPLTLNQSLTLLPLVNTPIIDYSLDWLQRNLIDETIVYCCMQHESEAIREHCRQWSLKFGNVMKVTVITSENCSSLGDAMRDLYSKSLLKSNFILLNGPVIGNIDLRNLLKNYQAANSKDPNCVMSSVYLKNKLRFNSDKNRTVDVVIKEPSGKILSHSRPGKTSKIVLSTELIQQHPKLKILPRLDDPSLAICSPIVPMLFSDNFDYGTLDSLIQGVIEQEELLGCSIHAQVACEGYAAVISSFSAYHEISHDVIKREVFPSVPERSLSSQRVRYHFDPFSASYWDLSAKFHKKSIKENVVIDAGSIVDSRCKIRNSVIGKHCTVKEHVTVDHSFLFSNVSVNRGSILDSCLIANDVKLLPGVHLEPGVILGPNCVLGPNLKVDRCVKLVKDPKDSSEDIDALVCGNEGKAFHYVYDEDENFDPDSPDWGAIQPEKEDEENSAADSDGSSEDEIDGPGPEEELSSDEEREQEFCREVMDSLLNAYNNKSAIENVVLEVNSSRHAYNVSMENVLITVTKCVLRVLEETSETRLTDEKLWLSIKLGLEHFGELMKNYIRKAKDQITVLRAIEEMIDEEPRFLPTIQRILYELSQNFDILDDEVIVFWHSKGGSQTRAFPDISKSISKFILWLKQNLEDESDDSDEV